MARLSASRRAVFLRDLRQDFIPLPRPQARLGSSVIASGLSTLEARARRRSGQRRSVRRANLFEAHASGESSGREGEDSVIEFARPPVCHRKSSESGLRLGSDCAIDHVRVRFVSGWSGAYEDAAAGRGFNALRTAVSVAP